MLRGLGLFHGKRSYGLSVEFNVQMGPITILGMTQTADGRLKMIAAEGRSIPGSRLEIGNAIRGCASVSTRHLHGSLGASTDRPITSRWASAIETGKIRKLAPARPGVGGCRVKIQPQSHKDAKVRRRKGRVLPL